MAYDAELYREMEAAYEAIRKQNREDMEKRRAVVFSRVPQIEAIDMEIKNLGLKLYSAALTQGDSKSKIAQIRARQKELLSEREKLLLENGFKKDELSERYQCKICNDTGSVGAKSCECYKKLLIQKAYAHSNLSTLLIDQSFETFSLSCYSDEFVESVNMTEKEYMKSVFDKAKRYVEQFEQTKNSLLFWGAPGLGKTILSTCIAKELLKKGYSVIYETAYQTFSMLEEIKFKRNEDTERLKLKAEKLYSCDFLILDDLGSEFSTPYTTSALFDIVNSRLIAGKKTLINTNLSLPELSKKYSERVFSRLMGHFVGVQFIGRDIRWKNSVNI